MGFIDYFSTEIMHPFTLYHGNNIVKITSDKFIGPVLRLCATKDKFFILSKDYELYFGKYQRNSLNSIDVKSLKCNVIDIDINRNVLYVVNCNGTVQSTNLEQELFTENWKIIEFKNSDLSDNTNKILISRMKCNSVGNVYVTNEKEIYGSGNCSDILNSECPVKLESFIGKRVFDVSAGDDFFIVLASDTVYENDDDSASSSSSLDLDRHDLSSKLSSTKLLQRNDFQALYIDGINEDKSNSKDSLISKTTQNTDDIENNLKQIIYDGYNLVSTVVISFGARNNGVLGIGDHIKRSGTNEIHSLTKIGVSSISSGCDHSLAKTVDGRVFQWGLNQHQQIDAKSLIPDFSSPKEIFVNETKSTDSSILIACCGDYQSILLNSDINISTICKESFEKEFTMHSTFEKNVPIILSSNNFILQNHRIVKKEYQQFLIGMQNTVRLCIKNRSCIKFITFVRYSTLKVLNFIYEINQLCQNYLKLLYILANCLQTINQFYIGDIEFDQLLFIKYSQELITIFESYTKYYCDIISINGFADVTRLIETIDIDTSTDFEKTFQLPFGQISNFIKFIEQLIKSNKSSTEYLGNTLSQWQTFASRHRIEIELAEHTKDFWQKHDKILQLKKFKQTHRRIILDSAKIPLKLLNSSKFSTNAFILFSDCFCQWGSFLNIYPLKTIWIQIENEQSLKITTPEKTFTLQARNHEDKLLWFDQFENSIINALGKQEREKSPKLRTVGYQYSMDHPKYAGVCCYGRWMKGTMHGVCHLEYPDGKVYYGDMRYGEMEGSGKMLLPSVGMYDGTFRNGRFDGYGIYEMKDNEIYEGYFRDGLFHGHGTLQTNNSTYVGEFVSNVKNGYGIYDDTVTGEKYMGMFADNKRTGAGTCITMIGDYFEGIWINDLLSGEGVAVFENGNYYEGELSVDGPTGKGCYYLPQSEIKNNDDDIEIKDTEITMKGNIISGNLSGSWNDIKVINGSVLLNQQFPKYPKSIGELIVNNNRKWRSLFENWEEQVFGNIFMQDTKLVWNRIAIYMTNAKERDKDQDLVYQAGHFAKNLMFQANQLDLHIKNSSSLDKISLRSTSSLYSKRSKVVGVKRKSYSNETLFDKGRQHDRILNNLLSENVFNQFINFRLMNEKRHESGRCSLEGSSSINDSNIPSLEFIPNFGINSLKQSDVDDIKDYLTQAFKDQYHPLSLLNQKISNCFYTSYGCWKVKPTPILSNQAMHEWESISLRIYGIIQQMFPALSTNYCYIEDSNQVVSHINLLYPIVLSEGIYSTLFVLYANKYSQKDEFYRQKLLICDKKTDIELIDILKIDTTSLGIVHNESFKHAITNLKQVKEKYCPHGMLNVIEKSMQLVEGAHTNSLGEAVIFGADKIMPLAIFLVLRAGVPHLGAELALLEDLLGSSFETEMSGFAGYCYTTIKAAYEHIISGRLFQS